MKIWLVSFLTLCNGSAYADHSDLSIQSLEVPCSKKTDTETKACTMHFPKCEEVKPYLVKNLEQNFKVRQNLRVRGLEVSFAETTDATNPQGQALTDPNWPYDAACMDGMLSPATLRQQCGPTVKLTRSSLIVGSLGAGREYGAQEAALAQGAKAKAENCIIDQVRKEVQSGALKVGEACSPIAKELKPLIERAETANARVQKPVQALCTQPYLTSQGEPNLPKECQETSDRNTQAGCSLLSAMNEILSAYNKLMECEVHARSEAAFAPVMSEFMDSYLDQLIPQAKGIIRGCIRRCITRLHRIMRCIQDCTVNRLQNRYNSTYPREFDEYTDERFGLGGSCGL